MFAGTISLKNTSLYIITHPVKKNRCRQSCCTAKQLFYSLSNENWSKLTFFKNPCRNPHKSSLNLKSEVRMTAKASAGAGQNDGAGIVLPKHWLGCVRYGGVQRRRLLPECVPGAATKSPLLSRCNGAELFFQSFIVFPLYIWYLIHISFWRNSNLWRRTLNGFSQKSE